MSVRPFRAAGLALLLAALPACTSGKATVTGKVTYKGTPLTMGEIHIRAADGTEVSGEIKSDGSYTVANVPPGNHKVEIKCIDEKMSNAYFTALAGRNKDGGPPIGPDGKPAPKGGKVFDVDDFSKIPAKYGRYETSGLSIEVKGSSVTKDFPLD